MVIPTTCTAINSPDAKYWKAAMDSEIKNLTENQTWDNDKLPEEKK